MANVDLTDEEENIINEELKEFHLTLKKYWSLMQLCLIEFPLEYEKFEHTWIYQAVLDELKISLMDFKVRSREKFENEAPEGYEKALSLIVEKYKLNPMEDEIIEELRQGFNFEGYKSVKKSKNTDFLNIEHDMFIYLLFNMFKKADENKSTLVSFTPSSSDSKYKKILKLLKITEMLPIKKNKNFYTKKDIAGAISRVETRFANDKELHLLIRNLYDARFPSDLN